MADFTFYAIDHGTYWWIKPKSFPDVVNVLIDLADYPGQVATDTTAGFAVRVPPHVYQRFADYLDLLNQESESTPDAGNVETVTSAPKKRGRPRKNPLPEGG